LLPNVPRRTDDDARQSAELWENEGTLASSSDGPAENATVKLFECQHCGQLLYFENMAIDFDAYRERDFDALLKAWLPITYAVNSLNQSMGQPDLYPFVLAPAVMGKLRFVHGLMHRGGT
jgi:hypothetical protein